MRWCACDVVWTMDRTGSHGLSSSLGPDPSRGSHGLSSSLGPSIWFIKRKSGLSSSLAPGWI